MDDSIAGGSHTTIMVSVFISRLGIFQIERKNFTRGERLRKQLKSHDMQETVLYIRVEERMILQ